MSRQLDEMHGSGQQTDRLIAQVAEQAKVAREALEENRRQFQRDQRPYVIPKAVPKILMPDQDIVVDLQSGNYGKTPAMKVGGKAGIFVGEDALMLAYQWFDKEAPKVFMRSTGVVIPPNTLLAASNRSDLLFFTGRLIAAQEFDSLMKKDSPSSLRFDKPTWILLERSIGRTFALGGWSPVPLLTAPCTMKYISNMSSKPAKRMIGGQRNSLRVMPHALAKVGKERLSRI
jgi:hypothetical protein